MRMSRIVTFFQLIINNGIIMGLSGDIIVSSSLNAAKASNQAKGKIFEAIHGQMFNQILTYKELNYFKPRFPIMISECNIILL